MKVVLESTTKIVTMDGLPCRVWQGKTESGIAMAAFIVRVLVDKKVDSSAFESELQEHAAPRADLGALPARLIND